MSDNARATDNQYRVPRCECGGALRYVANYGAPGVGQAWQCVGCGTDYSKVGGTMYLASDMVHVLSPEDVR